ncbi:META domain-containing protein [bacterium]|jgi:heat shock protein HslJ|nr:META domain-containing protein [bacterium]
MKKLIVFTSVIILSFGACKNKKEVASKETVEETTATAPSTPMAPFSKDLGGELVGKYWKATEIMGSPVEMPEGMKQEPYLQFNKDGSLKAHGGCNGIFGNYELGYKNLIEMKNFSQTEMECSFDSFESGLVEALTYSKQYILIGENEMHLVIGKRAPFAKFKAVYF